MITPAWIFDERDQVFRCLYCSEVQPANYVHVCHSQASPPAAPAPFIPPPLSNWAKKIKKQQPQIWAEDGNSKIDDLDDYIWNPDTKKYDKKDSPSAPKIYRTPCECGLEAIGYTHGHSSWCPRAIYDKKD